MKKLYFLCSLLCTLVLANGQNCQPQTTSGCTPDSSITTIISDYNSFPCIERAVPFNNSFTIKVPTTYTAFGVTVNISTIAIDSIVNLPCGMCWNANQSGTFSAGGAYCISLEGTTTDLTGVYKLGMYGTINTNIGSFPGSLDIAGAQFYVRVIDSGATCPNPNIQPADLSQTLISCIGPAPCTGPGWLPVSATPVAGQPCNYSSIDYSVNAPYTDVRWVFADTVAEQMDTVFAAIFNPTNNHASLQSVTATDSLGCTVQMYAPVLTNTGGYKKPTVCIATLDSSIGRNVIVWNRTDDSYSESISHYNVYSSLNDSAWLPATLIGTLPFNDETILIDTVNTPLSGVIKYMLSMVDTCGYEIYSSNVFAPPYLHLDTLFGQAMLRWNYYGGGDYTLYNMQVWKTNNGQTWQSIPIGLSALSGTEFGVDAFSYNEPLPDSGFVQYMVQYFVQSQCTPSPHRSLAYNSVFSNRAFINVTPGVIISSADTLNDAIEIRVSPNPAEDMLTINISEGAQSVRRINLYDLAGRLVKPMPLAVRGMPSFTSSYSIDDLASGIYLLRVESANGNYIKIIAHH